MRCGICPYLIKAAPAAPLARHLRRPPALEGPGRRTPGHPSRRWQIEIGSRRAANDWVQPGNAAIIRVGPTALTVLRIRASRRCASHAVLTLESLCGLLRASQPGSIRLPPKA